jgi:hypothetical protein
MDVGSRSDFLSLANERRGRNAIAFVPFSTEKIVREISLTRLLLARALQHSATHALDIH